MVWISTLSWAVVQRILDPLSRDGLNKKSISSPLVGGKTARAGIEFVQDLLEASYRHQSELRCCGLGARKCWDTVFVDFSLFYLSAGYFQAELDCKNDDRSKQIYDGVISQVR